MTNKPSDERVEKLAKEIWEAMHGLRISQEAWDGFTDDMKTMCVLAARFILAREQSSVSEATKLATAAAYRDAADHMPSLMMFGKCICGREYAPVGSGFDISSLWADHIRALTPDDCAAALKRNIDPEYEHRALLPRVPEEDPEYHLWEKSDLIDLLHRRDTAVALARAGVREAAARALELLLDRTEKEIGSSPMNKALWDAVNVSLESALNLVRALPDAAADEALAAHDAEVGRKARLDEVRRINRRTGWMNNRIAELEAASAPQPEMPASPTGEKT